MLQNCVRTAKEHWKDGFPLTVKIVLCLAKHMPQRFNVFTLFFLKEYCIICSEEGNLILTILFLKGVQEMREYKNISPMVGKYLEKEEKQEILYREAEELIETWAELLEMTEHGELEKAKTESKSLLAFEEFKEDIDRRENEWGASEIKASWNSLRIWRKVSLLHKLQTVVEKARKQELFRVCRKAESIENYIKTANYKIIEKEASSKEHFLRKCFNALKSLFGRLPPHK